MNPPYNLYIFSLVIMLVFYILKGCVRENAKAKGTGTVATIRAHYFKQIISSERY